MIRSADQSTPILQSERDALPFALNHHLSLCCSTQPTVSCGSKKFCSTGIWHLFDALRSPVSKQHRCSFGNTRCTTKTDQVETQRLKVRQQIGIVQVVNNGRSEEHTSELQS